ncbi:polysaccharide pyruvyl transferase family protein [Herbiconiux sp. CPCC 203407]|uniref:Polysaccharide pyruvyl transferase family protein n=1 Tax=Herbiconiux oxytropis TaxID=2970915 RepID=A0AA41XGR9_9MICO|nr:polysaccharide pyruvyl transferase family protein [Herbiconiux oxytropis]MCS5723247.1 polysaccharide pyruvyl transferase family protein [Herbiconiux oxytropis]MCS5727902.1 polysaccharide pyruvyl transferase family protein [Herbiconiux oxytropis]
MTNDRSRQRTVFCSISAQPDNLGDIAIRQALLDLFKRAGNPIVVFTGGMPASYLGAFDLPSTATVVTSQGAFIRSFLGACLRRRAHLVFAPGPFAAKGGRNLVKSLASLGNVVLTRASGGAVVSLGRAIRGSNRLDLRILRSSVRLMNLFVARDVLSPGILRLPVEVAPDLALSGIPASPAHTERSYVVISLRGDRPINRDVLADVVDQTREAGLVPVFVTQVRRDDENHRMLAAEFDAEICDWTTESHAEQFERIERIYSKAHTVFSDRLHAVIFGLRHVAFPIAYRHDGADKITPTLAHLLPLKVQDSHEKHLSVRISEPESSRNRLEAAVLKSSADLERVFERVIRLLTSR